VTFFDDDITDFLKFNFVIISLKNTIWPNHELKAPNRRLGGEPPAQGDF